MFKLLIAFIFVFQLFSCGTSEKNKSDSQMTLEGRYSDRQFSKIEIKENYKTLKTLDLDQMSDLLYGKVNDYKTNEQSQSLKEGVLIAFSRPNEDVILDKVLSIVKNPLDDLVEWQDTLFQITQQSIETIQQDSETASVQVTAAVVLENILSELKPDFMKQYETGGFETDIITKIANANLKLGQNLLKEKKLNLMRTNASPSALAQKLIENKNKQLKAEKKSK